LSATSATSIATGVGAAAAVAVGLLTCAAAVGYATGRGGVEHAKYSVVRARAAAAGASAGGGGVAFELRRYAPCVAAVAVIPDDGAGMRRMTSRGFRQVASFIFGGNAARDSVAMTAPVVSAPVAPLLGGPAPVGRSIAMTAPVVSSATRDGALEVSFLMPSKYQRAAELPEPLSRGVQLRELPARLEAVHAFGGALPDDAAVLALARRLLAALKADGLAPAPAPAGAELDGERVNLRVYAYDPPWTLPIFRLNEVSIAVADTSSSSSSLS